MEHVVIATFIPRAGREAQARQLLSEMREKSLGESGLLSYDCYERLDEPGTIVVVERYANKDAFKEHTRSDHFRAAMPALLEVFEAPSSQFLQPID